MRNVWKCVRPQHCIIRFFSVNYNVSQNKTRTILFVYRLRNIYSVSQKRPTIFFIHNFAICWSIFKIFSPLDSARNLQ